MEESKIESELTNRLSPQWRTKGFPISFILCAIIGTAFVSIVPDNAINLWRNLLIALTETIGNATGLTVKSTGDIMTVNGFPMQIIVQCTAIHYVIIVSSAIMLSRWQPLSYRLIGVVTAVPLLVLFNAIRLLCTGLAGTISRSAFVFVHSYLWVTVFILISFAIWVIWDKQSLVPNKGLLRFGIVATAFSSLFQLLLSGLTYRVDQAMALLANSFLKLLPGSTEFFISMYAGRLLFTSGTSSFQFSISTELVIVTVFAGLAAAEICKSKTANITRMAIGGIMLLLVSVAIITTCCPVIAFASKEVATLYLWVCQGLMLALPFATWSIIRCKTFITAHE